MLRPGRPPRAPRRLLPPALPAGLARPLWVAASLAAGLFQPALSHAAFQTGQSADLVLGQNSFVSAIADFPRWTAGSLSHPGAVYVSPALAKTFVADTLDNRVLIYNTTAPVNGRAADLVLGQPDMFSGQCNQAGAVGSATLCNPSGVIVSEDGKLLIDDRDNNRVLIWNSMPAVNGQPADLVVGQGSLNTNAGSCTGNFSQPDGLALDPGGRLYVANRNCSRVDVFNAIPTANGVTPDLVLGQDFFLRNGAGSIGEGPFWGANNQNANNQYHNAQADSFYYPSKIVVSMQAGKTFVADVMNNRVLIYNSTAPAFYRQADLVLGQPDFTSNECNSNAGSGPTPSTLCMPMEIWTDGTRLAVADETNNRVLIWNLLPTANGQGADVVVGQPNMTSNGPGGGANQLSNPMGVWYDSGANQFYVADWSNNRVQVYNGFPASNGAAASYALGQQGTGIGGGCNAGGLSASSLCNPVSVTADPNWVYVADWSNSRALLYPKPITQNYPAATYVLGQPNFNQNPGNWNGITPGSMNVPSDIFVATGPEGSTLYVTDTPNSRVLVWTSPITSNDQGADWVLGQPNVDSSGCNVGGLTSNSLCTWWGQWPGAGVWASSTTVAIADAVNNRVLFYSLPLTMNGQAATAVLGQPDFNNNPVSRNWISPRSLNTPSGVAVGNGKLYVSDEGNQRVLVWNTLPTANHQAADYVLGQSSFNWTPGQAQCNYNGVSATSLCTPRGLAASPGGALYVHDFSNHRFLVWTNPITSLDQPADKVLGQGGNLNLSGCNSLGLGPGSICSDLGQFTLGTPWVDDTNAFVPDDGNNRVLVFSPAPHAGGGLNARAVLGQPGMNTNALNVSLSARGLNWPVSYSMASDGSRLAVADSNNNRVLLWNSIPTANDQAADLVLGQQDMTGSAANYSGLNAGAMQNPSGVAYDGRQFFVADNPNHRVLVWNGWPTSNGQAADYVLGQPDFNQNPARNGGVAPGGQLYNPLGIAADGKYLYVADTNNHRVLLFSAPITANAPSAVYVLGQADFNGFSVNCDGNGAVARPGCMYNPYSVVADGKNVYVTDYNNNRVLAWNRPIAQNQQLPDHVLGQPDLNTRVWCPGPSAQTMCGPSGVYSDGQKVYVADWSWARILIWNSPITANYQAADVVLGGNGFTGPLGGTSARLFSNPGGLQRIEDRLFLADPNNHRVLRFSSTGPNLFNAVISSGMLPASLTQGQYQPAFKLQLQAPANSLVWNRATVFNDGSLPDGSLEVRLYADDGSGVFPGNGPIGAEAAMSNGKADIPIGIVLNASTQTYWVAVKVREDSLPLGPNGFPTGQIRILDNFTSFGFSTNTVEFAGNGTVNFPVRSGGFIPVDVPDFVLYQASSTAPAQASNTAKGLIMASLQLATTNDWAFLDVLNVKLEGSIDPSQIAGLSLWEDLNNDGVIDAGDLQLSGGTIPFTGGMTTLPLPNLALSATPVHLLLAADLSGLGTGQTFGIAFDTSSFLLDGVDRMSAANTPFSSALTVIQVTPPQVGPVNAAAGEWTNNPQFVFTSNLGSVGVAYSYFRTAFDQNPSHVWTDAEPQWTAGNSTQTATGDGAWYFHVKSYAAAGQSVGTQDPGPFLYDGSQPTGSGFRSFNSTGGAVGEAQWSDLASGVTAQIMVQDPASGLLARGGIGCGWDATTANKSCGAIKTACHAASNGLYWIDPRGIGPAGAYQAYCDMTNGGWTLAARFSDSGDNNLDTTAAYNGPVTPAGADGKISHADIQALSDGATVQNPIKMDFADIGVTRYIWNACSWTSGANRNKCASWAADTDATSHQTACGDPQSPSLNNGGGGEWASDAVPWPYLDGICMVNGGFASSCPNGCGCGNGDAFCSYSGWAPETGISNSGRYKVNIWVLGDAAIPASGLGFFVSYSTQGGTNWITVASTVPGSAPYMSMNAVSGSTSPATLQVFNLNLSQSTSAVTCAGAPPCGATNQVKFTVTDTAGNIRTLGPYAILTDMETPLALESPQSPANGGYTNARKPAFSWTGASTATVAAMPPNSLYALQVSNNDPNFGVGNLVVNVTTPIPTTTSQPTADASYTATAALVEGATYYWRVQARSPLGTFGPWSPISSFAADYTSPTASGFETLNSTGGAVAEAQWNNLASGVTAQMTVEDAGSGLNLLGGGWGASQAISGTMGLWHFDEGDGNSAADASGNGNTMALSGASWNSGASCRFGSCLGFNGSAYGTVPASNKWAFGTGDFTVSFWVYSGTNDDRRPLINNRKSPGTEGQWTIEVYNGANQVQFHSGTSQLLYSSVNLLNSSSWNHVAVTRSGTTLTLYINGVPSDSAINSNDFSEINDLQIGRDLMTASNDLQGKTFVGAIDEVRILNVAETASQIAQDAAGTSAGSAYSAQYTTNAGATWTTVSSTIPASTSFLSLASPHAMQGLGRRRSAQREGVVAGSRQTGGGNARANPKALAGAQGPTAPEALSVYNLNLAPSTNSATCNGASPCGATNQVRFTVSDVAGNVTNAGPFALLVDTVPSLALETPLSPANGSFINLRRPVFSWTGASTTTVAAMPPNSSYVLQVSNNDPNFGSGNLVVNITTPIPTTTSLPTADGSYTATAALADGATYYWRVQAMSGLGAPGPWSPVFSFVMDFTSPSASGFASFDAAGTPVAEKQLNNLLSGVTAQVTVQDAVSGLSLTAGSGVPQGVVGLWHFDEASGGTALDSSGHHNDGTLVNSPQRGPGKFGKSLSFDGSSNYVEVPNSAALEGMSSLTISLWAKADNSQSNNVLISKSNGYTLDYAISAGHWGGGTPNSIHFALNSQALVIAADGDFPLGQWFHVVGVYNGSEVALYINGVKQSAPASYSAPISATGNPVRIGGFRGLGYYWGGSIDEVAIYNRALSAGEIATLYSSGQGGVPGFSAQFTIDAGQTWQTVDSTVPAPTPYVSLSGAPGATTPQTLSVYGLDLAVSTNAVLCNGASPCGATNQVKFAVADLAGNVTNAGPYSIVVDTVTSLAAETLLSPANGAFVAVRKPVFSWVGASTGVVAAMPPGATYVLQVSSADPSFATASLVLNVTMPIAVNPALPTADGSYASTAALGEGSTYYWRVAAKSDLGGVGAWSPVFSFLTDFTSPTAAGFETFSSSGGAIAERQINNLSAGVTAQITVQDAGSGLSLTPTAGYSAQFTTNAGQTWQTVASTIPASPPYVALTGAPGATTPKTLTAYGLNFAASTNSVACGGVSPCGATNQVVFLVSDRAGNATTAGPFAVQVDTVNVPVQFSLSDAAQSSILQGHSAPLLKITMNTITASPGFAWQSLVVQRTGGSSDADVADIRIYRDNGTGVFGTSDTLLSMPVRFSGSASTITFFTNEVIGVSTQTYFLAVVVDSAAAVGDTLGVRVAAASSFGFTGALRTIGVFPVDSSTAAVLDGPDTLLLTPGSAANTPPAAVNPGSANIPFLKIVANTDVGTSRLQSVGLNLTGASADNDVAHVRVYRSAGLSASFDAAHDSLVTSGNDAFSNRFSTLAFTCSQSSATVGTAGGIYWVVLDLAGGATPADTIGVALAGVAAIHLTGALDVVAFSTTPFASGLTQVQTSNNLTVAIDSAMPLIVNPGVEVPAMKLTFSVNQGLAQVQQVQVNRIGSNTYFDFSKVRVRLDSGSGVFPPDPAVDPLLGEGTFPSDNTHLTAAVAIATQTINAGSPVVLWVSYLLSPSANTNDTVGANMANSGNIAAVSGFTAVSGNFPFSSGLGTIHPSINTLSAAGQDLVGGQVLTQGTENAAFLKLGLWTDRNFALLKQVLVSRIGSGSDADVANVEFYLASGSASGFDPAQDVLVSSGTSTFTNGAALLNLPQQLLITPSTQTFFIALDLADTAVPGDTVGIALSSAPLPFVVSDPNIVSSASLPLQSGLASIAQFPNLVTVSTVAVAPAQADPGQASVPLLQFSLQTNVSNATFSRLRLDRAGTLGDSNVSRLKVTFQGLTISPATAAFSNGTAILDITPQVITPAPKTFVVSVDLSTAAPPLATLGVSLFDASYLTVNPPNSVSTTTAPGGSFPIQSGILSVRKPVVSVSVLPSSLAPPSAIQGTANIGVLQVRLWANVYSTIWSRLDLIESGNGPDANISNIKVYRDTHLDGQLYFDGSDPQVSVIGAPNTFSQGRTSIAIASETVTGSTQTYFVTFDLSPTAAAGTTFGAGIAGPGAFGFPAPDAAAGTGLPFVSNPTLVVATRSGLFVTGADGGLTTLMQGATAQPILTLTMKTTQYAMVVSSLRLSQFGSAADSDISGIRVFLDARGTGRFDPADPEVTPGPARFVSGTAVLNLAPQTIGTTPKVYFVAVDVADLAAVGGTVSVGLPVATALTVSAPNFVVDQNFPMQTFPVTISKRPRTVYISGGNLATIGTFQGASNAPFLSLTLSVSGYQSTLNSLEVARSGSLPDASVTAVNLYKDANADGVFESGTDLLLASGLFSNGIIQFTGLGQTIRPSSATYFVAVDVDTNAVPGQTLGLQIEDTSYLSVDPLDLPAAFAPAMSTLSTIRDIRVPVTPTVTPDSGRYSHLVTQLSFEWQSRMVTSAGTITGARCAIGTSPGGDDIRNWWVINPVPGEVIVSGLQLVTGGTYYVTVTAVSNFNFTSDPGVSIPILEDSVVPAVSGVVSAATDVNGSVILSWPAAAAGPSGVMGYLLQYQNGQSPLWYDAKSGTVSTLDVAAVAAGRKLRTQAFTAANLYSSNTAILTGVPAGTYLYRLYVVNGAGVLSASSISSQRLVAGPLPATAISGAGNYPNPFDSRTKNTTIIYTLNQSIPVRIQIYDVYGNKLTTLSFPAGSSGGQAGGNSTTWDGTDSGGRKVSKGVYLAVIQAGGAKETLKIAVIH